MDKLKPCPWCGGRAEAEVYEPCDDYPGNAVYRFDASVDCTKCRATHPPISGRYKTKQEAIEKAVNKWNKRNGDNDE